MPSVATQNTLSPQAPSTYLGTKPISKLLFDYSMPAIVASVATSLYNIIDSFYIGNGVGDMALAGLAITFPLMNLMVAFSTLITIGGATISSILLGQKNIRGAIEVVNNVMALCLIHSVVFGGLALCFLDPILRFFGATENILPYAREFMRVILGGTIITYVFFGLNNVMRATGYPVKAMITTLLSVIINVLLAPLFIFVFKWGIAGAAWATICAQFVSMFWIMKHFLSSSVVVHLDRHNKWLSGSIIKKIYPIGLSPFLMNVCACVVVSIINWSLLKYGEEDGDMVVGAYGIINRMAMVFLMLVFGITQGMQPILGYNYGAGEWTRVKRTLRIGMSFGLLITTVGWLITELFPDAISGLFTHTPKMISMTRVGFRLFFAGFLIVGGQVVIQNFFQSIGKPMLSILLSMTRQLLFLIPFLIVLPIFFGLNGVWASMAAADVLAFIVAIIILMVVFRRQNRRFER